MDLKELNEKLDKINLEKETKNALIDLINGKIESDMKEVISAIGALNTKFDSAIGALRGELNTKFDSNRNEMSTKFDSNRNEMSTKFDSNRNEMNASITSIRWMLGIVGAIAAAILGKMLKLF